MRNQYRDVDVDVSLARLRTVRVYVVGDVRGRGPMTSARSPLL